MKNLLPIACFALACWQPVRCGGQALTIKETNAQVVGGTPGGGLIVGQTRCDNRGNLYFRQLQGAKVVLSPVVQVSADGARSHVFDFLAQSTKELKSLAVTDFSLSGSKLYMVGSTPDAKVHVLEYSIDDAELMASLTLDDPNAPGMPIQGALTVSKLGVMPSGELLIFGVRTLREDLPNTTLPKFSYNPVLELYTSAGQFATSVSFKSDQVNLNDKAHSQEENFAAVDLALTANGPDGVYLVVYSNNPVVYVVSPAGEVSRRVHIEPIGNEFRPISLSVVDGQLLVEFVRSSDGSPETTLARYDANSGERYSLYKVDTNMGGIFSCYDGRGAFTFISTDALGQRVVKLAKAR